MTPENLDREIIAFCQRNGIATFQYRWTFLEGGSCYAFDHAGCCKMAQSLRELGDKIDANKAEADA